MAARSFVGDVALTVAAKATFVVLGFVTTVIVARGLGPTGQGAFAVAFNLTLLLVQAGNAGLTIANPVYTARHPGLRGVLVINSLSVATVLGGLLAGAAAVVAAVAPQALPGLGWAEIGWALAAIPLGLATLYLQFILLGERRMGAYSAIDVGQATLALIGVVLAFALTSPGVALILAIMAASRAVTLVGTVAALREVLRPLPRPDLGLLRTMVRSTVSPYVVGLVAFALIRIDLLLVNALVDGRSAGLYSLVALLAEGLSLIPAVVGINLLQRISTLEGDEPTLRVFRGLALVFGAVCLVSVPAVGFGLVLVFGRAYSDSVGLYILIVPGIVSLGLANVLAAHYAIRGYPRKLVWAWVGGLGLNVVLNAALLPVLGVVVAPIASTVAYTLVLVLQLRVFAPGVGGYRALIPRRADAVALLAAVRRSPAAD